MQNNIQAINNSYSWNVEHEKLVDIFTSKLCRSSRPVIGIGETPSSTTTKKH